MKSIFLIFATMLIIVVTSCVPAPSQVTTTTTATVTTIPKVTTIPTLQIFVVTADYLNIRNKDGIVVPSLYLKKGDVVTCTSIVDNWCILGNDNQVWTGCLNPNPNQLGCRPK